jgi:ferredoxin
VTIAVMMCGDGLDRDDRDLIPPAVAVIEGLCNHPATVGEIGDDAEGMVLVLHPEELAISDLQAEIRAVGLDPLGVPIIDAAEYAGDPAGLVVAVAGAVARAESFPGSLPAHAKPVFPSRLTRRSLFTIPHPAYVAAPAIDPTVCAAEDGCAKCVAVCPEQAYAWVEGRIVYDKDVCQPCGRCVTACPPGAISNPGASPSAIADQIRAIIAAAPAPVGIAFRCRRGTARPMFAGWHAVEVPCTGMVTAPWAVAPLLLGAAQVAVVRCGDVGCDRELDTASTAVLAFVTDLLVALGIDRNRVGPTAVPIIHQAMPVVAAVDDPFGPRSAPRVYEALRVIAGASGAAVGGDEAMIGTVSIDPAACTMCTRCTQTCPTGALAGGYVDDGVLTLTFDPTTCTACDQCIAACPEIARGAIAVQHGVDFRGLARGRVEVNRSLTHRCERCGQPVAPAAMLAHIGALVGDEPALMDRLTRLCLSCRGAA